MFLEGNMNLDGLIWLLLGAMFGPAIVLAVIGLLVRKKSKKVAKVFFILAVVYVIVSLGVCGTMMS
jgi:hypothetical protein